MKPILEIQQSEDRCIGNVARGEFFMTVEAAKNGGDASCIGRVVTVHSHEAVVMWMDRGLLEALPSSTRVYLYEVIHPLVVARSIRKNMEEES